MLVIRYRSVTNSGRAQFMDCVYLYSEKGVEARGKVVGGERMEVCRCELRDGCGCDEDDDAMKIILHRYCRKKMFTLFFLHVYRNSEDIPEFAETHFINSFFFLFTGFIDFAAAR